MKENSKKINVKASFNTIAAPGVIGGVRSHSKLNDSVIYDLEFNALKNNDTNVVSSSWINWIFDKWIVTLFEMIIGKFLLQILNTIFSEMFFFS